MQDILQYIIKWSIALCAVFLFYRFVLRALTFYQWNRQYLVVYSIVALFIPFINLYTYVPETQLQKNQLVKFIPVINIGQQQTPYSNIDPWLIGGILMLAGSMFLLARLIIQWISLARIRRNATRIYHPEAKVYHVNENVIPFSFGDAIYVNTSLHTQQELNDIILHEFVHVRQKHSFDIIWSEILCIVNWYNPFAWLIRHAIRQNLEFIADQSVLNHGLDKKTYQYHLLKVIGSSQYSIANNFNFSSLKKRIAMMNRLKSARVHLVKFLFVLPLLAVMLVAFRNSNGNWYKHISTDTIKKPEPPPPPPPPSKTEKPGLPPPPQVEPPPDPTPPPAPKLPGGAVSLENVDGVVTLKFKDGRKETYDLNNPEERAAMEKKYGKILRLTKFPANDAEAPKAPKQPKPSLILVPSTKASAEVEEVVEVKQVAVTEPVIHLKGDVSVSVADSSHTVVHANEIVVHGYPIPRRNDAAAPVYYVDGKKAPVQDARVITETYKISHMEIIKDPNTVKRPAEVSTMPIINLVTVQNAKNVNAYMAKESTKIIEEVKVKEVPKPRDY